MTFVIVVTLALASALIIWKIAGGRLKGNRVVRDLDLSVSGLITALGVTTLIAYAVAIGVMATNLVDNVSAMDQTTYEQSEVVTYDQLETPLTEDSTTESIEPEALVKEESTIQDAAAVESPVAPVQASEATTGVQEPVAVSPTSVAQVSTAEFADGTYSGTGNGFRGNIAVDVTVQGGNITKVSVTDQQEDRKWFERAYSGVVQRVLSTQSENVDTVSGATYSSRGIIDGVAEALSKARAAVKQVAQ